MPASDKSSTLLRDAEHPDAMLPFESLLGTVLKRFLSELTMINGSVMIGYICSDQHSNIEDLVASSAECALKPGRVSYAHHAHLDFDWGAAPTVVLGMEMLCDELTAFFNVVLGDDHVGVEIQAIQFGAPMTSREACVRRFASAVFDARLPDGVRAA